MKQIIHSKVQKWGNSLGIRISGSLRELTNFEVDTDIIIQISEDGFTVKRSRPVKPPEVFLEDDLLDDLSEYNAHTELLAAPLQLESEWVRDEK